MSTGIRQAALCLYGLNEGDRRWLLKQLPRTQRNTIKAMLRELRKLGIPVNLFESSQHENVDSVEIGEYEDLEDGVFEFIEKIDQADLNQIKKILQIEMDIVVAAILKFYPWTWGEDYLQDMGSKRRSEINDAISSPGVQSYQVNRALLQILNNRLEYIRS